MPKVSFVVLLNDQDLIERTKLPNSLREIMELFTLCYNPEIDVKIREETQRIYDRLECEKVVMSEKNQQTYLNV